jgi:hypothetical protein
MYMFIFVDGDDSQVQPHVQFVLDCITLLPLATGHSVIKKVVFHVLPACLDRFKVSILKKIIALEAMCYLCFIRYLV